VELLAVLAISLILIGAITMLSTYASKGVQNVMTREQAAREARTILNHIVQTTRHETAIASQTTPTHEDLSIEFQKRDDDSGQLVATGNYTRYRFAAGNNGKGTLTMENKNGATQISQVLSRNVRTAKFVLSNDKRSISIELVLQLDANQTYTSSTTVHFPKLIIS